MNLGISQALWNKQYFLICLAALLFFSSYHLLTPVLPLYLENRQISGPALGSIIAAFMLASLLIRPFVGKKCDETGKKRMMFFGVILFSLSPLLYPLAPEEVWLYVVRIIHGGSFAIFYTALSAYLTETLPAQNKAEGLSYYSNAIKVAMAFTPGFGLLMAGTGLLPQTFGLASAMGLLTLCCILALPAAQPTEPHQGTQPRGKLLNQDAMFPGWIMASNSMAFGALIPFVPMLLAEKNLDAAALFYTVYAVFLIFSRAFTGKLSDTYGRDAILIPGLAMVVLSLVFMAWASHELVFLVSVACYGLSAGTVQPSLMALAVDRSKVAERGSAMATFTMMTDLGIAAGSFLMGSMGAIYGYSNAILAIAFFAILGWVFFFQRSRKPLFIAALEQ
jgi:MFS family permease